MHSPSAGANCLPNQKGSTALMPALTEANDIIRARNVAASECYALLDEAIGRPHPYTDAAKIFDRLTAPASFPHIDQTEAMAIGVFFEPYVARYAARKLGLKLRANTRTVEHPTVSLCATPDYLVLNKRMLVEVKVSSIMYGWTEDDLLPWYEWQARAQLACTNRDVCLVVALVGSNLFTVPVVRDREKEERLLSTAQSSLFSPASKPS